MGGRTMKHETTERSPEETTERSPEETTERSPEGDYIESWRKHTTVEGDGLIQDEWGQWYVEREDGVRYPAPV